MSYQLEGFQMLLRGDCGAYPLFTGDANQRL